MAPSTASPSVPVATMTRKPTDGSARLASAVAVAFDRTRSRSRRRAPRTRAGRARSPCVSSGRAVPTRTRRSGPPPSDGTGARRVGAPDGRGAARRRPPDPSTATAVDRSMQPASAAASMGSPRRGYATRPPPRGCTKVHHEPGPTSTSLVRHGSASSRAAASAGVERGSSAARRSSPARSITEAAVTSRGSGTG